MLVRFVSAEPLMGTPTMGFIVHPKSRGRILTSLYHFLMSPPVSQRHTGQWWMSVHAMGYVKDKNHHWGTHSFALFCFGHAHGMWIFPDLGWNLCCAIAAAWATAETMPDLYLLRHKRTPTAFWIRKNKPTLCLEDLPNPPRGYVHGKHCPKKCPR